MAAGLIERRVDGQLYEFQQFGAKQGLALLSRLAKIVGEPLSVLLGNTLKGVTGKDFKVKDILDKEIPWDVVLPSAVKALIERLNEDEVIYIVEELTARHAHCNGKRIVFDTHFQGKLLSHLPKVLWAALEVQYGNFSEGEGDRASPSATTPFQSIQAR